MIGIYKITSPTGKIYIGQAVDIERRWQYYKKVLCVGQTRLHNSFKKHGVENHIFEVVEECPEETLNTRERYWQEYHKTVETGLNSRLTSTADKSGKLSEETKQKIGKSNSIAGLGKIITEETRAKMSKAQKGKVVSEDAKQKMSERSAKYWKDKKFTEEHKANIVKGRSGYKHSEETIEKIRQSHIGKQHTEETKQKIAEQRRGKSSGAKGQTHSEETKQRLREINTGRKHTQEAIEKIRQARLGKKVTEETKEKIKQANLRIVAVRVKCPHCDVTSTVGIMKRWHFDNCKSKLGKYK